MNPDDRQDIDETVLQELVEIYQTDYEVGQDNINAFGLDLRNPVFLISAFLILAFVIGSLIYPQAANEILGSTRDWIGHQFDWLFLSTGNVFVLFCLALIALPVGRIRLGGTDAVG